MLQEGPCTAWQGRDEGAWTEEGAPELQGADETSCGRSCIRNVWA